MTKEELARLERIEHTLSNLGTKLDKHLTQEDIITPKLEEVLEIFIQAQGALRFIKICSAIGATITGAYLAIKEVLQHWK